MNCMLFSADTEPLSSRNSKPRHICLQSHAVADYMSELLGSAVSSCKNVLMLYEAETLSTDGIFQMFTVGKLKIECFCGLQ